MSTVTAEHIKGLAWDYLAVNYDEPKPIPKFHMEMWDLCCSDNPKVAIAAPRLHAKSTAITHTYTLMMLLSRVKRFCLIVSSTESLAIEFLGDIKAELEENEPLRRQFGIKKFLKEKETNVVCLMNDGHKFRIQVKGSEQKVRGLKWRGKRPDLIICDDLEGDEQVMSTERREKFRNWFMNALIPCGSDSCWVRVVGTILHLDSMLNRLLDDKTWKTKLYQAEDGNFKNILWPEKFSEKRLKFTFAGFEAQNNAAGYAQEYRNQPVAMENLFFNADYFLDFERDDNGKALLPNLEFYAAADFAISEKEKADYTAIVVGGVSPDGILHIVDVRRGQWGPDEIKEELFSTQKAWNINYFVFESGQIDKGLRPDLNREMYEKNIYINIEPITPTKSKIMRARSIQARHKARAIRYDKEASWYPAFEAELMMVDNSGPRGKNDDQLDAFAYLGLNIDKFWDAMSDEELEEEEWEEAYDEFHDLGRSDVTGY